MTFDEVYEKHRSFVYSVCFNFYRNREDAEDATQETFMIVLRKLHQFDGRSAFTSWLYRIAYNKCLMRRRDAQSKKRNGGFRVELEDVDSEKFAVIRPHIQHDIRKALTKMPPGYKKVLMQYAVKGLEHEEIAKASGFTVGNSKSQLFKAREKMKTLLEGYHG